jgi:hypothetical protein
MSQGLVSVLAAPAFDPGQGRITAEFPVGMTIAQIVEKVLPDRTIGREFIRVSLVTDRGTQIVPPTIWHRAYPNAGVRVVIRVIPGKNALRSILQIVVSIAAVALGQYWALGLGFTAGTVGFAVASGLIGIGVSVLGNLLINALIPPEKPESQERENRYAISGWRNRLDREGAVPVVLGTIRYAPPFAALSYSEIVGNWLYIRSLFNFGYGRLTLSDLRIGETDISEYDEVETELRSGLSSDAPIALFPRQVAEENVGAELTRPFPRDDLGEIISGSAAEETPVTRTTGADASGASIIFSWPAGLYASNDKGGTNATTVSMKVQHRLVTPDDSAGWADVVTLNITARTLESFYRQHTWDFPSRGRWEIRVIMLTPETTDIKIQQRTTWAALQTIRPEYPLNFAKPLSLAGLRIKATHQLNGQLDNFSAVASRICLDYDHTTGTWTERATSNPASLYRYVLQSNANPRPVSDAGIDLDQLGDWHDFCRIKGLKFDGVIDDPSLSLGDMLSQIAGAGRAAKRHDGVRWGVVIDRPQTLVVDHINPRNAYNMRVTRTYIRPPHGFRVKFLDATNDYKPAERLVPWPGHSGPITLTEQLELPGKTDPAEVWREARRRMYEALYRPDIYEASQDGPARVATRGDLVMLSMDILDRTQATARVRSIEGRLIELSDPVTMDAGVTYAVRFRVFADEEDTIGTSVVRQVVTAAGETRLLRFFSDGDMPAEGDIVHFGRSTSESIPVIIQDVEAGENMSVHYRMVDAAPIIDELTDEEVAPAWNGRVGSEIDAGSSVPPTPKFTSIATGLNGAGQVGAITALLSPGTGSIASSSFRLQHRLNGSTVWNTLDFPASNGGATITGYATGDVVQLRAAAISPSGALGAYTTVVSVTVGATDASAAGGLDDSMISVGALLGGAVVQFSTSADTATTQVQIYRSSTSSLNRTTDAIGGLVEVVASRSYSVAIGDATRENLLINGAMSETGTWTLDAGWEIAAGVATHTPGSMDAISQPLTTIAGQYFRVSTQLSGVTAGTLTPRLTGGTTRAGTARLANGIFADRIQATAGNNTFELLANSAFDGSVDNVVAYLETATCLAQGTHYIWVEPQNADGLPGPVSGPFTVTIR